ncbi:MAG: RNA polymerase sigma factor [Ferruginibacter sp.]
MDIIDRLKKGDKTVYAGVVKQCEAMIYNTALSIVHNEQDAEDITQEVFVTLYEKIHGFRKESKLTTWLYTITIRKALDQEKKRKNQKHGGLLKKIFAVKESNEPGNFDHPGILLDNKETARVLFQALKKLPENQRIAFTLHKMEGLSHLEIADVLKTSPSATESLLVRAKNNLKKILKDYYEKHL